MNILFIHEAFPAQFGRIGLALAERHGWNCRFLVRNVSSCPTPSARMLERLELRRIPLPDNFGAEPTPWPLIYGDYLTLCEAVAEAIKIDPGPKPDLIVAHGGRGAPTIFLRDHIDCPIAVYCEYYFAQARRDISYRIDLPPAEPAQFFPRTINAPTLMSLVGADSGYSATEWQKASFPDRFHSKIEVHFDGIDTELYRPGPAPRQVLGKSLPAGTKVVTFVSRGLESIRGFDIFLEVAARISRERSDVLFVIAGQDRAFYGWDTLHTGQASFKDWGITQLGSRFDPSRFVFLGHVEPEVLADLLRITDLHFYLTVPFVLSWSFLSAMACGAVVLASDVGPVREVIDSGIHGLLEPLFDVDRLTETALAVLADPAQFAPLGKAAQVRVAEKYSLEVAIPALKDYYERAASF